MPTTMVTYNIQIISRYKWNCTLKYYPLVSSKVSWGIPEDGHLNGQLIELNGWFSICLITKGYSTKNVVIVTTKIRKHIKSLAISWVN